jgi:hypothetical protein
MLLDNFIPTCSVMFRRGLLKKVPGWVGSLKMGDWLIHILNALHGKVGFINETMAVYVIHRGGVWSMKDERFVFLAILEMYEALDKHLGDEYTWIMSRILRGRYFVESMQHEKLGDLDKAIHYVVKSMGKNVLIIAERLRRVNRNEPHLADPLQHVVYVSSSTLIRNLLRLYIKLLKSLLKIYFPPLYKLLRVIARRQDLIP